MKALKDLLDNELVSNIVLVLIVLMIGNVTLYFIA
jgi:hypothetical protein